MLNDCVQVTAAAAADIGAAGVARGLGRGRRGAGAPARARAPGIAADVAAAPPDPREASRLDHREVIPALVPVPEAVLAQASAAH